VGLRYNSHDKKLLVTISEGRGLKSCDSNGFSDPYVEVRVLPDESKKKQVRRKEEEEREREREKMAATAKEKGSSLSYYCRNSRPRSSRRV